MLIELLGIFGLQGIFRGLNTQSGKDRADKWGRYIDGNGIHRYKRNGRKIVNSRNEDGDIVLKYANTGRTAVNISKEEANSREKEAIRKGNRFYLRQSNTGLYDKLGNDDVYGERYCEVGVPNKYYVKRFIDYTRSDGRGYCCDFYMDMECNLVCPTDEQLKKDKEFFSDEKNKRRAIAENPEMLYEMIIERWNEKSEDYHIKTKQKSCIMSLKDSYKKRQT